MFQVIPVMRWDVASGQVKMKKLRGPVWWSWNRCPCRRVAGLLRYLGQRAQDSNQAATTDRRVRTNCKEEDEL